MILTATLGTFVLQILGLTYAVKQFTLTKRLGQISTCEIRVFDYNVNVSKENTGYPDTDGIQLLVDLEYTRQTKLLTCRLVLLYHDNSPSVQARQWFSGDVVALTPVTSTSSGTRIEISCSCMGKACLLLFSIYNDYINIPALRVYDRAYTDNLSITFKPLDAKKLVDNAMFGAIGINAITMCLLMLAQKKNTIADMLKAGCTYFQSKVLYKDAEVDLGEYITSEVKLSSAMSLGDGKRYLLSLAQDFLNGLKNSTVYSGLLHTLQNDKLLTIKPAGMDQLDKLEIIPIYVTKVKDVEIPKSRIIDCALSTNFLYKLRMPQVLYCNLTHVSDFSTLAIPKHTGVTGVFHADPDNLSLIVRVKSIPAPPWVLKSVITLALQKAGNTMNTPPTNKQTTKPADVLLVVNNKDKQTLNTLADAYAKSVFFQMYKSSRTANLRLAFDRLFLPVLDACIGLSIYFECPLRREELGENYPTQQPPNQFYGKVLLLQYQYTSADSPQHSSNLDITCGLTAVTNIRDLLYASEFTSDTGKIYQRETE